MTTVAAKPEFANDGSYESVERQLHALARRCHLWVSKLGLGMDYDDVFQEMNLSYLLAKQKFDASQGVKFITYMTIACMRNFKHTISRAARDRTEMGMMTMSEFGSEDGGEGEGQLDAIDQVESSIWDDGRYACLQYGADPMLIADTKERVNLGTRMLDENVTELIEVMIDWEGAESKSGARLNPSLSLTAKAVGMTDSECHRASRAIKQLWG